MATTETFVIVGASLAGATAAQSLREEGFTGRIVLIGEEPNRPYERPPLSKGYLLGTSPREDVFVHPADWYAEHDVDLRLSTRVTSLDRTAKEVVLDGGERIGYDRLLLTTGSEPRRLRLPGATADGVLYLRRLEDSETIRAAYTTASRVAIIGAGWIGLETAAAARAAGLEVTVLEAAELPLLRVLGPEVAEVFAGLHRDHGVDLRFGVQIARLTTAGEDGETGAVTGVELADGTVISADVVLVGVGITPVVSLAADAGLDVTNGVRVDDHLRTSDPSVYAAGDVANAYHPGLRREIRVEHWENARRQGAHVAKTMLGQDVAFDRLPYFFSDQYDLGMEYTGYVAPGEYDQVVLRGDVEALIGRGRQVDVKRLGDVEVPLGEV